MSGFGWHVDSCGEKDSKSAYTITANLLSGRRVPSYGRYPRSATVAYLLSHGDEFAIPSYPVLLEISVQIARVDVLPASCTRYNQRPLLLTAGRLHLRQADTEMKRLVFTAPVVITSASLKLQQEQLNRCGALVTFQLRYRLYTISPLLFRRRLLTMFPATRLSISITFV